MHSDAFVRASLLRLRRSSRSARLLVTLRACALSVLAQGDGEGLCSPRRSYISFCISVVSCLRGSPDPWLFLILRRCLIHCLLSCWTHFVLLLRGVVCGSFVIGDDARDRSGVQNASDRGRERRLIASRSTASWTFCACQLRIRSCTAVSSGKDCIFCFVSRPISLLDVPRVPFALLRSGTGSGICLV